MLDHNLEALGIGVGAVLYGVNTEPRGIAESPLRPSSTGGFSSFVTSPLLRLLPGGTNQFPGGICAHFGLNAFHGARGPSQ